MWCEYFRDNMKNTTLDVVFSINHDYLQHFTVALTSLLQHNHAIVRHVFLVYDFTLEHELASIEKYFATNYNIMLEHIQINIADFAKMKVMQHHTIATYYRLILADILPPNLSHILYLDSDLVIESDLAALLDLNFFVNQQPYYLYAVSDIIPKLGSISSKIIDYKDYFNAGVMYLNLDLMRADNVTEKLLITAVEKKDFLKFSDQDVLNLCFYQRWGELEPSFNNVSGHQEKLNWFITPKIIHYIGRVKPWHLNCRTPLRKRYWYYLRMTPYRNKWLAHTCILPFYLLVHPRIWFYLKLKSKLRRIYRKLITN